MANNNEIVINSDVYDVVVTEASLTPNQITLSANTNNVAVTQAVATVVHVSTPGPKGDSGPKGDAGSIGSVDTGSFAITGSNTFYGLQTITGSNGRLVYTGTTPGAYPTLAEVHINNDYPWLHRFYNDTFSTSSAVMAYFGWNDGRFVFHNESTQSIGLQVNGYSAENGLLVYSNKVAFVNDVVVTGSITAPTINTHQINPISGQDLYIQIPSGRLLDMWTDDNGGEIVLNSSGILLQTNATQNTWTFNKSGSLTVPGNITGAANLATTGSVTFTGNQIVTGSSRGNVTALSITSNTASMNLSVGNFFTLQLVSGSNTYINPSNILPGQTSILTLSTTGSATVSWSRSVKQPSGSAYVPTTTTSVDIITLASVDSSSLYVVNIKNMI
jgi:hypothetical protein